VTLRHATGWVLLAALAGLAGLVLLAPAYLTARGLPLDDAWIHAVYARSIARTASLTYNPGVPTTGATSPLWPVVIAIPHLLSPRVDLVVASIKMIGFACHTLTALLVLHAFAEGRRVRRAAVVGAALVALHPDLISASVSGMEVPLSSAMAAALLIAVRRGSFLPYLAVCVVAPLARPELAVLGFAMPVAFYARAHLRRAVLLSGAAGLGTAICFAVLAIRHLAVSGLPLPATFYVKAGAGGVPIPTAEFIGFSQLLGQFPIADSSLLITAAAVAAMAFVLGPRQEPIGRLAAAALLAALVFCMVSFALVRPVDPGAFYHQRYVMPVLPLIVASTPLLLDSVVASFLSRAPVLAWVRTGAVALFGLAVLIDAPTRYWHLDNDARNIDEVQVAVGRALATARPDQVAWAIDAGAVRYFGSAFVVDLIGLNNAELLGPAAQQFLDTHRPRFIEVVPGWSALDTDSGASLSGRRFEPSTRYTVTGFPPMRQHFLVLCDDPSVAGTLRVRSRSFAFKCAG
jgi:hypothetical protein